MPRPAKDIRELVTLASQPHIKSVTVKKNGNDETKFKLRGPKFVYTFTVYDNERAKKFISSLAPGTTVTEISNKKPKSSSSY